MSKFPLLDVLLCHLAKPMEPCDCAPLWEKVDQKMESVHFLKRRKDAFYFLSHTDMHPGPPSVFPSWLSNLNANVPKSDSTKDTEAKIIWRSDELYILIKQPKRITPIQPFTPFTKKWINKYGRRRRRRKRKEQMGGNREEGSYWVCVIAALTACGLSLYERSEAVTYQNCIVCW